MALKVAASAAPARSRTELVWLGDGAWVACDPRLDEHDPGRVLAYLECKDSVVYVLWVRDPRGVVEFASLRDALAAVDAILLDGMAGGVGPHSDARVASAVAGLDSMPESA
jgi:hypothetical protein